MGCGDGWLAGDAEGNVEYFGLDTLRREAFVATRTVADAFEEAEVADEHTLRAAARARARGEATGKAAAKKDRTGKKRKGAQAAANDHGSLAAWGLDSFTSDRTAEAEAVAARERDRHGWQLLTRPVSKISGEAVSAADATRFDFVTRTAPLSVTLKVLEGAAPGTKAHRVTAARWFPLRKAMKPGMMGTVSSLVGHAWRVDDSLATPSSSSSSSSSPKQPAESLAGYRRCFLGTSLGRFAQCWCEGVPGFQSHVDGVKGQLVYLRQVLTSAVALPWALRGAFFLDELKAEEADAKSGDDKMEATGDVDRTSLDGDSSGEKSGESDGEESDGSVSDEEEGEDEEDDDSV